MIVNNMKSLIFSVLLVIKNEEKYIGRLLERLLNQDFPSDQYEIIVVDGRSSDRTLSVVESYQNEHNAQIQLFENKKETLPVGWNIGIKAAKGMYVLRIDGHTEITADLLARYWKAIKTCPEAACVGGIVISKGDGFQGEINEYIYSHPFGVGRSMFRILNQEWEGFVDTVPYGAYKRSLFNEVGLFNEDLKRNEDIELHQRVRDAGGQFYLTTSIKTTYFVRDSLKGLIDKSLGDGMWSMIADRKAPGALSAFKKVPLYSVVLGLFLILASFYHLFFLVALSLLV